MSGIIFDQLLSLSFVFAQMFSLLVELKLFFSSYLLLTLQYILGNRKFLSSFS